MKKFVVKYWEGLFAETNVPWEYLKNNNQYCVWKGDVSHYHF